MFYFTSDVINDVYMNCLNQLYIEFLDQNDYEEFIEDDETASTFLEDYEDCIHIKSLIEIIEE